MGRAKDWRTDRSPVEAIPSRCCGQGGAERGRAGPSGRLGICSPGGDLARTRPKVAGRFQAGGGRLQAEGGRCGRFQARSGRLRPRIWDARLGREDGSHGPVRQTRKNTGTGESTASDGCRHRLRPGWEPAKQRPGRAGGGGRSREP
jgi:hypothetical protein